MSGEAGLVLGALVRWPAGPGSPLGVVVGTDGNRVEVRLDGIDEVRVFNARSAGIERVPLQGIVRRLSNGAIGSVHAQATAAPPRWQVLVDQRIITVAEADLRPRVPDDARSRILAGRLGSARQFSLAITARRCEIAQMTSDLVALGESRVAVKPHQVSVVHRVITSYPHRFLLCDEVGLGKTIEAGMILEGAAGQGRRWPVHCDRAREPAATVAVRAEVEVQRNVLDYQQGYRQVPAPVTRLHR